jgi:hypothetical protein
MRLPMRPQPTMPSVISFGRRSGPAEGNASGDAHVAVVERQVADEASESAMRMRGHLAHAVVGELATQTPCLRASFTFTVSKPAPKRLTMRSSRQRGEDARVHGGVLGDRAGTTLRRRDDVILGAALRDVHLEARSRNSAFSSSTSGSRSR